MLKDNKKKELRSFFLDKRKKIKEKRKKEFLVNIKLLDLLKDKKKLNISGYYSIRNELNIIHLIGHLRALDFKISLPFIYKKDKPLLFKQWGRDTSLEKGIYNIKIPKTKNYVEPDLIIVPLLAFDLKKYRLGYGGGFYDRTIIKNKKKFVSVGVAFDEQETDIIPINKYDQVLDMIITPKKIIV